MGIWRRVSGVGPSLSPQTYSLSIQTRQRRALISSTLRKSGQRNGAQSVPYILVVDAKQTHRPNQEIHFFFSPRSLSRVSKHTELKLGSMASSICVSPSPLFPTRRQRFSSLRFAKKAGPRVFACKASVSSSVVFRNLRADDFRHPLDQQNTVLLRTIPGLNELGKTILATLAEQLMILENIGTSVLVAENQLSSLHKLMVEAAQILNIEAPDLYVRQSPVPNAYTLAISGRKPFVVVHTSLVELLTRKELQAVLAHELGHLKCDHGVWLTMANIMTLGAYSVPGVGGFIARSLEDQLFRWLRAAELTCDRAALLVAQDPKVVISVMMKLAGGCPSLSDQLNVDAFLEQARSYDKASATPFGWYLRNAQTSQLSHPLPVLRAREIDEWSRSQEYQSLLKRATRI